MSSTDAIRDLLISYKAGDSERFEQAAHQLIADARRKKHTVVAREYERILEGVNYPNTPEQRSLTLLGMSPADVPVEADRKTPLVEAISPSRTLDDIIITTELRSSVASFITEQKQSDLLVTYGLRAKQRLLFCGPPGCGKTVTAEAIAHELYLPLALVRFDSLVSSYLGETAANLRKVFDFATKRKCVLLFDEFDMIAKERSDESEHGELKRVVSAFLQMLDRFTGESIIIAATNHEQMLDIALWRRFDDVLSFPRPTVSQSYELMSLLLRRFGAADEIRSKALGQKLVGLSFNDVERVCVEAIKRAILRDVRPIDSKLLLEVATQYTMHRKVSSAPRRRVR